jgi:hypothetical protein
VKEHSAWGFAGLMEELVLPTVLSPNPQILGIGALALSATAVAVTICSWGRIARFQLAALYVLAWFLLAMAQIARGASPGRYYVWTGLAEWAGLLLATAIVGWLIRHPRIAATFSASADGNRWFMAAQALLMAAIALLVGWIATDFSFDGMGAGSALFGLAGRTCACPSALMLLGASIVMAWQSSGWWRAAWQFAAMAAGVLFTTSIGLARIDPVSQAPWLERAVNLLVSTSMMTIMTRFGLPRVLPEESDWIVRGRQASPVFAAAALFLLAAVLMEKVLTGP